MTETHTATYRYGDTDTDAYDSTATLATLTEVDVLLRAAGLTGVQIADLLRAGALDVRVTGFLSEHYTYRVGDEPTGTTGRFTDPHTGRRPRFETTHPEHAERLATALNKAEGDGRRATRDAAR